MDGRRALVPLAFALSACAWGRVETQAQDDGLGLLEVEGGGQPSAELPVHAWGFVDSFSDGSHFARGSMRADVAQGAGPVVEFQAAGRQETAKLGVAMWPRLPIVIGLGVQGTVDSEGEPQIRLAWDTLGVLGPWFSCGGFLDANLPGLIGEAQVRWHVWRDARIIAEGNLDDRSGNDWVAAVGVQWAW